MPNKQLTKADLIRELDSVPDDMPIWIGLGDVYQILPLVDVTTGHAQDGTLRVTLFGDYTEYSELPNAITRK